MRRARMGPVAVAAAGLGLTGCGSIGQPLPPALHIPQRVTDLSAVEQGDQIVVQFTVPTRTTENLLIRKSVTAELGIGPAHTPFDLETWTASAQRTEIPTNESAVKYGVPAAGWAGKTVVIAVEVLNERGRTSGWSNQVTLAVIAPLAPPGGLKAEGVSEGVRLTWQGAASGYRIYRRVDSGANAEMVGESADRSYTDKSTEYGKAYRYSVETFRVEGDIHAASDRTAEVEIMPVDIWPPPVPSGLAAIASPGRIELAWERNVAPDLAGYNIYRAEGEGPFRKIGEARQGPSYSDSTVMAGKTYRYAVSAFDQIPNESEKSAPVSIQAH